MAEFITALQAAINQMSADGQRILCSLKSVELSKYMQTALDEDWRTNRGMEIVLKLRAFLIQMIQQN